MVLALVWLAHGSSRESRKGGAVYSDYAVDAGDFLDAADSYASFNEFFYRKLKPSARPIAAGETVAVFPADGRHLAIADVSAADSFYIKGQRFDLAKFLGSAELAAEFEGGSMLISRLCPVDYHRYHFPVSGKAGAARILDGSLRSVSPLALRRKLSILWENRRMITEVESDAFGKMVVMEVGATCVGGMHSTFTAGSQVEQGADKGYFSFGGSCVTTVYKKGAIRLDDDLAGASRSRPRSLCEDGRALWDRVSHWSSLETPEIALLGFERVAVGVFDGEAPSRGHIVLYGPVFAGQADGNFFCFRALGGEFERVRLCILSILA